MVTKERNGTLDFLKFIFCLVIVIMHGQRMTTDMSLVHFGNGRLATEFFFIVSGCMMAWTAEKQKQVSSLGVDTFRFMKKRILSVMPDFYVAWVFAFVVAMIPREHTIGSAIALFSQGLYELFFIDMFGIRVSMINAPTWYLSTMFISMLIIFPMIRKYKDVFSIIIAPIIALFMIGYLMQTYPTLPEFHIWTGLVSGGLIRGFSEILLGCISYQIAMRIKRIPFTKRMCIIFSIIEWLIYVTLIVSFYFNITWTSDFLIPFSFFIAVTLTVSQMTLSAKMFRSRVFGWLGRFSFDLYLTNWFYAEGCRYLLPIEWSFQRKMIVYMCLSVSTALIVMFISIWLRYAWTQIKPKVERFAIAK